MQPHQIYGAPYRFSTAAAASAAAEAAVSLPRSSLLNSQSMTPKEVVSYLDDYIIGQADAKKAVAIAFRNRWRRQHLPIDIKNEVRCPITLQHITNMFHIRSFQKTF